MPIIRHFRNEKETGVEMQSQSCLGTGRSAIGQFFSMSLVTVPEVFVNVKSAQFSSPP